MRFANRTSSSGNAMPTSHFPSSGNLLVPFKRCRSHELQEEFFQVRMCSSPEMRSNAIVMLVKESDFRNRLCKHWRQLHVSLWKCTRGWAHKAILSINHNWRMAVYTTPYLAEVTNELSKYMKRPQGILG